MIYQLASTFNLACTIIIVLALVIWLLTTKAGIAVLCIVVFVGFLVWLLTKDKDNLRND